MKLYWLNDLSMILWYQMVRSSLFSIIDVVYIKVWIKCMDETKSNAR